MTYQVSPEAIDSFKRHGYAVLERAIEPSMLSMLDMECGYFVGYMDAWMTCNEIETLGITHKGKRYFISNRYRQSNDLHRFLFSPLMAEITKNFLGPSSYLFVEQWVVKGAEQGMKFAWHQDSGYVKFIDPDTQHKPYLTCWCALDDMSPENGTISVLPHDVLDTHNRITDHVREAGTNDLVGYDGPAEGVQLSVPAGSIVVFSSLSLHRSSANTTKTRRRAYLAQYSAEPILSSSGQLWSQAVPFTQDEKIIYDHSTDQADKHGQKSRLRHVQRQLAATKPRTGL